jgi:hypothetical protein
MRYLWYIPIVTPILWAKHTSNPTPQGGAERAGHPLRSPRTDSNLKAIQRESRLDSMAKVGSSPYPDTRLPVKDSTIRLLQIDRKLKSAIVGKLEQVSLDSKGCPNFTTISYVWGKYLPEERVDITVNGAKFPVAPSIPPILELIRDHADFKNVRWIWIDGICINQNDKVEKNTQVEMMGRIYKKSEMTVAWLGKAEKDTDAAMNFLKELLHRKRALQRDHELGKPSQPPADLRDPEKWKSLRRFFSLPWWNRVWTLQEFILARKLKFYWGDRSIGRRELKGAVYAIWLCKPGNHLIQNETWKSAWNRRRLHQWHKEGKKVGKSSLLAWMSYNSKSQVSDPRDRIYGVLALANKLDRELVGKPNYEDDNDAPELYRRLVMSWIQAHSSLDIICFSHQFNSQQLGNLEHEDAIPSWVPDWRTPINTFVIPLLVSQSGKKSVGNFRPVKGQDSEYYSVVYAASGDRAPKIRLSANPKHLSCEGILIDTIDGLGGMEKAQEFQGLRLVQSTSPENINTRNKVGHDSSVDQSDSLANKQLLDGIVRCLVLDRHDRYLGTPAPVKEFRENFQLLVASGHESKDYPPNQAFATWFQHNRSLLIRGHTLDQLCKTATIPSTEKEVSGGEKSFVSRTHDTIAPHRMARRLMTARQGFVGMAPARAKDGDAICVLYGCSVPVILRRRDDRERTWEFIGECYMHGFMNGEALDSGRSAEEFILS